MDHDPLKSLLKRADAEATPPPALPADLTARVQRAARQRRRRRRVGAVGGAAAMILLAAGLSLHFFNDAAREHVEAPPRQPVDIAAVRAEVRRLDQEAKSRAAVARRLAALQNEQRERKPASPIQPAPPDPVRLVRAEVDRAAYVLVMHAAQLERELKSPQAAMEGYRRAARLFPKTAWAAAARQRLSRLEHAPGDQL